jgi:hypothetical protein
LIGIATEAAIFYNANAGKQRCQRPGCGRFGSASFAADQNTSDAWIDGIQDQRPSHTFLTYNRCEWVN